jgi:hypothetical protein
MKVQVQQNDWTKENGKEKLWFAENPVTGRVYFSSPMSRLQPGYVLKSTTEPREMDRIFNRMHDQEREHNERFVEQLYNQGRERYEKLRSGLRDRLASGATSEAEKNIIRASLKMLDEQDAKRQQNNVYGISSMQETEAPIAGQTTKVTVN